MQTNQSYTSRISSLVPDRRLSASLSLDLQLKAAEVNKTLSRNDGSPDKSLKVMKEDIQAMLAEMKKRQLAGQKSIAEDELEYGHTNKPTNTRVPRLSSPWHKFMKMHPLCAVNVEEVDELILCMAVGAETDCGIGLTCFSGLVCHKKKSFKK